MGRDIDLISPFPNGTIITKTSQGQLHQGTIIYHDARRKYYRIRYQDTTTKDMTHHAIDKHLYWERKLLRAADPLTCLGYKHHTNLTVLRQAGPTPPTRRGLRHGYALAVDALCKMNLTILL